MCGFSSGHFYFDPMLMYRGQIIFLTYVNKLTTIIELKLMIKTDICRDTQVDFEK